MNFRDESDSKLSECIKEIFKFHQTGVLPLNTFTRELEKKVRERLGVDEYHSLRMTEEMILLEVAHRWSDAASGECNKECEYILGFHIPVNHEVELSKFYTQHMKCINRYGCGITYSFTPTGLGEIIEVKCKCGKSIDLTESEKW